MDLYQQLILDHSKRPVNAGLREPFQAEVHHVNPTCGDEITLRVHVDGDVIDDVSYDSQGARSVSPRPPSWPRRSPATTSARCARPSPP